MSAGVNRVTIIGRLGKDPEVKFSQSGAAVCNFSLAVNERRKDGDNWVEKTEWIPCVIFGKTAENFGEYMSKGREVYLEGRLETTKYTDKNGVEKYSTKVVAFVVQYLGGKGDGGGARGSSKPKPAATAGADSQGNDAGFDDDMGDLPF